MGLAARAAEASAPQPYTVPPSKQFDGNDGYWSTFKISVGTPGQDFRVLPSTKGGVTYLILPEGCQEGLDPSNCRSLRGIDVFQSSQNIGYQVNISSTWSAIGQYDVDLEQALNFSSQGLFGFDSVILGPAADKSTLLSLDHQVVAGVADPDYYLGVLPLGQAESSFSSLSQSIDSLLYQLRNATKIPSFSYAYTAGAKYRLKSVFGNLILGGYDSTRFKPNANDFSFTFSQDPSKLLTVGVASIMATNSLVGTVSMTSGSHFSVVDSTVSQLWLPKDVCAQFESAFGLTYDPHTDLYLVNQTIHEQLLSKNPTVTIKLANSLQDTLKYTNIQLPYGAFDLQASYPFYQNATNYFPIRRAANDSQYVLGRTLLQEAYLIVDYERGNFSISQAVFPDPLPAAKVVNITPPNTSSTEKANPGLSTGAIAGIAVGAVLFIVAIAGLFLFLRRRRTREKRHELGDREVSESSHHLNPAPLKSTGPQELGGTPLTELASPREQLAYQQEQKTVISVSDTPQELHAESRTPVTARWQEVTLPRPNHLSAEERGSSASRSVSREPSDDGLMTGEFGPRSGVSPLTPQFQRQYR